MIDCFKGAVSCFCKQTNCAGESTHWATCITRGQAIVNGVIATRSLATHAHLIVFHGQFLKWRVNSTQARVKKAAYSEKKC